MNDQYISIEYSIMTIRNDFIRKTKWLNEFNFKFEKIVNFGCHIGNDTLGLLFLFGAKEVTGIDINQEYIIQAKNTYFDLKESLEIAFRNPFYQTNSLSVDKSKDYSRFESKMADIRYLFNHSKVEFLKRDITRETGISSSKYDLSYCDLVLHHIWYDEDYDESKNTRNAISEMIRVVKPGGYIILRELVKFDRKPTLDFQKLFSNNVKLISLKDDDLQTDVKLYVYKKEAL